MSVRNRNRYRGLGIYTAIYLVFLYLPVLFLPIFSVNDSTYIAFPLTEFTWQWYRDMAGNPALIAALVNSLKVGVTVSIVSTIFGMLAAMAVTRYRLPGQKPLVALISVPLVIPLIILGISLLSVLNVIGIKLSLFTIGLAHTVICVPFSMLVLMSRLEGFDKSVEEAARDLGETPWMTFWRVTFPLALPGVVASLLLTFTISLDEFILAFFLAGDQVTLPVYIWGQLRFPAKLPTVLALGTCILLFTIVLVTMSEWVRRRGTQTTTVGV